MDTKFIRIPESEYDELVREARLAHKQRFTIAKLEREMENYKAKVSCVMAKTQKLLSDIYPMEVILQAYKENDENDN